MVGLNQETVMVYVLTVIYKKILLFLIFFFFFFCGNHDLKKGFFDEYISKEQCLSRICHLDVNVFTVFLINLMHSC